MHNRVNWRLTTVKQLRNVLRLITEFGLETRDVDEATMDADGNNRVFGDFHYPVHDVEYTVENGDIICNYDFSHAFDSYISHRTNIHADYIYD